MSDELILTEELLTEFLDPVSAKAYEWKIESDYPATCKFQASFEDDHEKRYYLSFYRDSGLGKNARKVIFSVKKNKNLNPKINVDKGSFIKILGTIIQIYQAYKLNDADGKMSNSYGFQFPDSFAKYMPFVHKVIKRLFKTNPKIKLDLYGAVDSQENFTIMYYVNPSSHIPYFGGPKADLNVIRGEFFQTLTGETADSTSKGKTDTEVMSKVTASEPVAAYKKAYKFNVPKPDPEVVAVPKAVEPEPVEVKKDWEKPTWTTSTLNFGGGACKADTIQMLIDSGSSSLKKDQTAKIYGLYVKDVFMECYTQFSINESAAEKIKNYAGTYVLVVNPISNSKKYVAFSVDSSIISSEWKDERFLLLGETEIVGLTTATTEQPKTKAKPKEAPKVSTDYAKKDDAKTFELPQEFLDAIKKGTFHIGPVQINVGGDISLIGIADKIKEVEDYFGKMPLDKRVQIAKSLINEVSEHERVISKSIYKYLSENELFFGTNTSQDNVEAVRRYTGSGYSAINNYLRGFDKDPSKWVTDCVSKIDEGFSEEGIRFPRDLNVYRGASISLEGIAELNKHKTPLTGYASVSIRPNVAYGFGNFGGNKSEMVRGALLNFDNESGKSEPGQEHETKIFQSKQGNKILYSINRLDRCLAIAVDQISENPGEDELILNRGTEIQMREGYQCIRVVNKSTFGDPDEGEGLWMAKVEIAPLAISESSLRTYLIREQLQKASNVQDNLAMLSFYFNDVIEES